MKKAYGGGGDAAAVAAETLNWFTHQEFYADDLQSEARRAAGATAAGSKAYDSFSKTLSDFDDEIFLFVHVNTFVSKIGTC